MSDRKERRKNKKSKIKKQPSPAENPQYHFLKNYSFANRMWFPKWWKHYLSGEISSPAKLIYPIRKNSRQCMNADMLHEFVAIELKEFCGHLENPKESQEEFAEEIKAELKGNFREIKEWTPYIVLNYLQDLNNQFVAFERYTKYNMDSSQTRKQIFDEILEEMYSETIEVSIGGLDIKEEDNVVRWMDVGNPEENIQSSTANLVDNTRIDWGHFDSKQAWDSASSSVIIVEDEPNKEVNMTDSQIENWAAKAEENGPETNLIESLIGSTWETLERSVIIEQVSKIQDIEIEKTEEGSEENLAGISAELSGEGSDSEKESSLESSCVIVENDTQTEEGATCEDSEEEFVNVDKTDADIEVENKSEVNNGLGADEDKKSCSLM